MSPPCTLSERPLRRTFIRTNAAAGHTGIRPYADGFNVVGCTATRNSFTEGLLPGVDARDNTSTTGTGVPIYWLKGARVANNYADFYDGSWDDEANVKNESGSNGLDTNQSANYPWTGCEDDGTEAYDGTDTEGLGNSDEAVIVGRPDSSDTGHGPISSSEYEDSSDNRPMYGLSQVFELIQLPSNAGTQARFGQFPLPHPTERVGEWSKPGIAYDLSGTSSR